MNLLFSVNRRFVPLLFSCLNSIALRGGEPFYRVFILHSDLTADDQAAIRAGASACFSFSFLSVPGALFEGFPESDRYPVQIYYRLAAPHLLPPEPDRVLYLDVDTVVINPLAPLYNMELGNCLFAACTHTGAVLEKFNQVRLQTEKNVPYINTGVLLMNLTLLRKELDLKEIGRYAREKHRHLLLPDQDILTALYGGRVRVADTLLYNLSDRILAFHNAVPANRPINLAWVEENSVIIHYFGKNKPWKENYRGILDRFYHQYGLPLN